MAEIKKIKLGSTTYDIRDASAASRLTELEGETEEIKTTLNGEDLTERINVSTNDIYSTGGEVYIDLPTICDAVTLSCRREGSGPLVYWNDIVVTSTPTTYDSTIDESGEYGDNVYCTATFSLVTNESTGNTRILMLFSEPGYIYVDKVLVGRSVVANIGALKGKVAELEDLCIVPNGGTEIIMDDEAGDSFWAVVPASINNISDLSEYFRAGGSDIPINNAFYHGDPVSQGCLTWSHDTVCIYGDRGYGNEVMNTLFEFESFIQFKPTDVNVVDKVIELEEKIATPATDDEINALWN